MRSDIRARKSQRIEGCEGVSHVSFWKSLSRQSANAPRQDYGCHVSEEASVAGAKKKKKKMRGGVGNRAIRIRENTSFPSRSFAVKSR